MNLAFSFHHLFLRFDIFEFQVFHNFIFCFSFADYIHFTLFLNIFENYFELMAAFKHTQNVFLTNAQISRCTLFGLVWFICEMYEETNSIIISSIEHKNDLTACLHLLSQAWAGDEVYKINFTDLWCSK